VSETSPLVIVIIFIKFIQAINCFRVLRIMRYVNQINQRIVELLSKLHKEILYRLNFKFLLLYLRFQIVV